MKVLNLVLMGSLLIGANSFAGNEGSGGGDANSTQIRAIKKMFENDGEFVRKDLLAAFSLVTKFHPQGETTSLIHSLVRRGIMNDVKEAPYILKSLCVDENGIERSASTLKVNLTNLENPTRPEICINVRKLAHEKASRESIIGLIAHEHARHFGEEDTDELGLHPLADFISVNYSHLTNSHYMTASSLGDVITAADKDSKRLVALFADRDKGFSLVIDKVEGKCKGLKASFLLSTDYLNEGSVISISDEILSIADKPEYSKISKIFIGMDKGFFNKGSCKVSYHFEANGVSSPIYQATIASNSGRGEYEIIQLNSASWLKDIE